MTIRGGSETVLPQMSVSQGGQSRWKTICQAWTILEWVRTVETENEVYFVGKDIAGILGYQNGSRDINRHVDEDDRRKVMFFDGNQDKETIIINESGLYSLVLSSKLPNAKKFKRWVTSEVLPSIRKNGGYISGHT